MTTSKKKKNQINHKRKQTKTIPVMKGGFIKNFIDRLLGERKYTLDELLGKKLFRLENDNISPSLQNAQRNVELIIYHIAKSNMKSNTAFFKILFELTPETIGKIPDNDPDPDKKQVKKKFLFLNLMIDFLANSIQSQQLQENIFLKNPGLGSIIIFTNEEKNKILLALVYIYRGYSSITKDINSVINQIKKIVPLGANNITGVNDNLIDIMNMPLNK
jgi:hypothetical protein